MINRLIANCCFTRGQNYQRHPAAKNCLSSILNLYSLCYLMFRLCRPNVTLCRLFIYVSRSSFTSWYCVFWSMFCGTFYCFIMFHDVSSLHLLHCFRLGRSSNSVQISARHGALRFFNTNNLWVDLVALKREFRRNDGALPLPVMKRIGEGMDGDGGFFTGKWCLVFGGKYVLWGSYHIDEHSPGVWQNYVMWCFHEKMQLFLCDSVAVPLLKPEHHTTGGTWNILKRFSQQSQLDATSQPPDFTETILFQQLPNIWPDPITLHNVWIRINPKYCIYLLFISISGSIICLFSAPWTSCVSFRDTWAMMQWGMPRQWIPETRNPRRSCNWRPPWVPPSSASKVPRAGSGAPRKHVSKNRWSNVK